MQRLTVPIRRLLLGLALLAALSGGGLAQTGDESVDLKSEQALVKNAQAEVEKARLDIMKRQQQLLGSQREGSGAGLAAQELELSQDKHRLALQKAAAAEFRLTRAKAQSLSAEQRLAILALSEQAKKSSPGSPEHGHLEKELAELEKRIATLESEAAAALRMAQAGEAKIAELTAQLEAKWGSRFSGKKPTVRVFRSDPERRPEPQEATEL
jgi:chromosome segregation ATPase